MQVAIAKNLETKEILELDDITFQFVLWLNENKYTKGETYTLTLNTGKFVSNQLSESNKVTFKIERDE